MESGSRESELSIIKMREEGTEVKQPRRPAHSIEKGCESRFYFEKVLNFDYCLLLFSIMSIVLSVLYYDADYAGKSMIATACLILIFGISLIESKCWNS